MHTVEIVLACIPGTPLHRVQVHLYVSRYSRITEGLEWTTIVRPYYLIIISCELPKIIIKYYLAGRELNPEYKLYQDTWKCEMACFQDVPK